MSITATELKNNLSKYLLLAATEDVYITRNIRDYAKSAIPVYTPDEFIKIACSADEEADDE